MKDTLRAVARAVVAALTSPEAVKLERGLLTLVVVRVLLAVGASASLVEFVKSLIGG